MQVRIALVEAIGGKQAILRGNPEDVRSEFFRLAETARVSHIHFSVEAEVGSFDQETELWKRFDSRALNFSRPDFLKFVRERQELWQHYVGTLWRLAEAAAPKATLCEFGEHGAYIHGPAQAPV